MWYKIKEGRHRAYPLSLGIHTGKTEESYEVMFPDSCMYMLDSENQKDWNKLVGWSYGLHHQNSIRIGWRYDEFQERIELTLYTYENKERRIEEVKTIFVPLNTKVKITLARVNGGLYSLFIPLYGITWLHTKSKPTWGYNLGLYFGGSKSQPNKEPMKIYLKKL